MSGEQLPSFPTSRDERLEPKFQAAISQHFDLWLEIINTSTVTMEIKDQLIEALMRFKSEAFTSWSTFDDAVYGTISQIVTVAQSWKKKEDPEIQALMQNLRDDLWSLRAQVLKSICAD
ncbi:MAG: hypothetical protein V1846_01970 [Candidatus Komeilibacteria bacterium]